MEGPFTNDLAEVISSMLKERPHLSRKVLCRYFRIAKGTCLRILHDTPGMKMFHFRWVPHALDTNQKFEGVTLSRGILLGLQSVRRLVFRLSSLEMNRGSFCAIAMI
jgi:hypothetical protein